MRQINIFVSCSHLDINWISESSSRPLIPWLAANLQKNYASVWYDHVLKQSTSEEYKRKIKAEIDAAHIAVLLISQNYAHSDFISEYELPWIKERVNARELIIVPVLVEPTECGSEPHLKWIFEHQMLPGEPTPLINYTNDKAAFLRIKLEILEAIRNQIDQLRDYPIYQHDTISAKASQGPSSRSLLLWISIILITLLTIVLILVLKQSF